MNTRRMLKLDITSDPAQLPGVREAVRAWIGRQGWPEEDAADIVLAVDEALSNVIRHGYEGRPGQKIEIRARAMSHSANGNGIEIRIRDYGKQVPIQQICGRDLDDVRPGGLGVHIIRSVMSTAEYSHAPGGGMQLVMRKYRQPPAADPGLQAEPT